MKFADFYRSEFSDDYFKKLIMDIKEVVVWTMKPAQFNLLLLPTQSIVCGDCRVIERRHRALNEWQAMVVKKSEATFRNRSAIVSAHCSKPQPRSTKEGKRKDHDTISEAVYKIWQTNDLSEQPPNWHDTGWPRDHLVTESPVVCQLP